MAQDVRFSSWKQGFDSPWGRLFMNREIASRFTISLFAVWAFFVLALSLGEFTPSSDEAEPTEKISSGMIFELPRAEIILSNRWPTIPFVVQSPLAEWANPIFQGACEETAALMVAGWLEGKSTISPTEAREELTKMSRFTQTRYGHFYDLSAADTARLLRDYFGIESVELKYDITVGDIRLALAEGAVMIIHVNGQKLKNPYFVPPGPPDHTIVVFGYDAATGDFITHDPGTRRGENFRYHESVLAVALRDYPTGYHEPNPSPRTVMIIIRSPL